MGVALGHAVLALRLAARGMAKLERQPRRDRRRPRRRVGGAGRGGADRDAPPRPARAVRAAQGADARQGDHARRCAFRTRCALAVPPTRHACRADAVAAYTGLAAALAARGWRRRPAPPRATRMRPTSSTSCWRRRSGERHDAVCRPGPRPGQVSRSLAARRDAHLRLLRHDRRRHARPGASPSSRRSHTSPPTAPRINSNACWRTSARWRPRCR